MSVASAATTTTTTTTVTEAAHGKQSQSSVFNTDPSKSYESFLQSTLLHLRAYRTDLQKQQERKRRAQKLSSRNQYSALQPTSGRALNNSSGSSGTLSPSSSSSSTSSPSPPASHSHSHSHVQRYHKTNTSVRRHGKAPAVRVGRVGSRRVTA